MLEGTGAMSSTFLRKIVSNPELSFSQTINQIEHTMQIFSDTNSQNFTF
jgi:hypothetical protein